MTSTSNAFVHTPTLCSSGATAPASNADSKRSTPVNQTIYATQMQLKPPAFSLRRQQPHWDLRSDLDVLPGPEEIPLPESDDETASWRPRNQKSDSRDGLSRKPSKTKSKAESTSKPKAEAATRPNQVTVGQFASLHQVQQYRHRQKGQIQHQQQDLQIAVGLSSRLVRVCRTAHRGLVECLRLGDKPSFVAIHKTVQDLRDVRSALRDRDQEDVDYASPKDLELPKPDFVSRLPPHTQDDLLELLNLIRSDPQYLYERLGSLSPSQLTSMLSASASTESSESTVPRSRSQTFIPKRNSAHLVSFQDRALAFERSDPLSILLFNVYASPFDRNDHESDLRLETWASLCAKLVTSSTSDHLALVGHVISTWASSHDWIAKTRFELYLMDTLQKGAFLLEGLSADAPVSDPMHTDVAEEFFETAVQSLFGLLDDTHGGLPSGALKFINAISQKLQTPDVQLRFRNFVLHQWFFSKFLSNAITYPENHGLLLDTHISKDAREKLLGQVALRALTQVSRVISSTPQFAPVHPITRTHIDSMVSHLHDLHLGSSEMPVANSASDMQSPHSTFLVLCTQDLLTLIDTLYPVLKPSVQPWETIPTLRSPADSVSTLPIRGKFGVRKFENPFSRDNLDNIGSRPSVSHLFSDQLKSYDSSISISNLADSFPEPSPADAMQKAVEAVRWELVHSSDPDPRLNSSGPFDESWAVFPCEAGKVTSNLMKLRSESLNESKTRPWSARGTTEEQERLRIAILRLVSDFDAGSDFFRDQRNHRHISLEASFQEAIAFWDKQSNPVEKHYWWQTLALFRRVYPFCAIRNEDYKLLQPLVDEAERSIDTSLKAMKVAENSLVSLDRAFDRISGRVREATTTINALRTKMWYMTDVKNSQRYGEAKNVALALKSMTWANVNQTQPPSDLRSRNGSRSYLQKPEVQVMNLMKASLHQGGPYKLADDQVELTKKWLDRSGIDNFCMGEERIHRFCYEVKTSVNCLVGETIVEGPVLWSSELFQREKGQFETSSRGMPGTFGGRPLSIVSDDTPSGSYYLSSGSRPWEVPPRSQDGPSLTHKSSFQSLSSERWRYQRDSSGDAASILDSPGRTVSASTAESLTQFWSPLATQTHSFTSASSYHSRPPSIFNEATISKRPDRIARAKTAFLDKLRQSLTSLLLSDLGCPVWSTGSETDAWFSGVIGQEHFRTQMAKRAKLDELMGSPPSSIGTSKQHKHQRRRRSLGPGGTDSKKTRSSGRSSRTHSESRERPVAVLARSTFSYPSALRQLVEKVACHSSPFVKLKALDDLRRLIIELLISKGQSFVNEIPQLPTRPKRPARHSMSAVPLSDHTQKTPIAVSDEMEEPPGEGEIVNCIRDLLHQCQPKTLFRDLQFIAAFVPSEILNHTESGKAFLHVGLAALALKSDVCQSLVETADRIVSHEVNNRYYSQASGYDRYYQPSARTGEAFAHAARLYLITAKEGNPTAQRELAILYLTHPEQCQRVTLPLTKPKDTFRADMMYHRGHDSKDPQSMCLALHWMQLAATNGDEVAKNKLREREELGLMI